MERIGANFHRSREVNRAKAYRQLLDDLSNHMNVLVPYAINLKDCIGLMMDIEGFLKGAAGEEGQSPLEAVQVFLNRVPDAQDRRTDYSTSGAS